MKNGYKVFDADTHLKPTVETVEQYLDSSMRARVPGWESNKVPLKTGMAGEVEKPPFRHLYRFRDGGGGWGGGAPRVLGEAGPRDESRHFQTFMGSKFPTYGAGDFDPDARIRDMNEEGVDVHLLVPGGPANPGDPALEMGFIQAHHRYLDDFTSKYPHRLKSLITVTDRAIEESVQEIKTWGRSSWAVGVIPSLTVGKPLDHPDLEPIWAAAEEEELCVVHHSFAAGYPGYRDLWDNPFLGRLSSHPWGAMRAVGAFLGAGVMDRYPNLRFGILESGFGWLPFWAKRMDDQAVYMGYVNEQLKYKLSEYLTSGRFFAAVVLHEGQEMVKMVTDFFGDHVLMYSSDYPHAEARYPDSVDLVMGWDNLSPETMHKLMWENAVRFYGEP